MGIRTCMPTSLYSHHRIRARTSTPHGSWNTAQLSYRIGFEVGRGKAFCLHFLCPCPEVRCGRTLLVGYILQSFQTGPPVRQRMRHSWILWLRVDSRTLRQCLWYSLNEHDTSGKRLLEGMPPSKSTLVSVLARYHANILKNSPPPPRYAFIHMSQHERSQGFYWLTCEGPKTFRWTDYHVPIRQQAVVGHSFDLDNKTALSDGSNGVG